MTVSNLMKKTDFLKEDILAAYDQLGGYSYLLKNSDLMERILLRMIKQPNPLPTLVIDLNSEFPWLDYGQRLSYKHAVSAETAPPPQVKALALGWKKPQETSETRLREDIDKLGS